MSYTSDLIINSQKADLIEEDNTNGIYYLGWTLSSDTTKCKLMRTVKTETPTGFLYENEYINGNDNFVNDWANRKSGALVWNLKR